jgi:galactofuranose transport system substrate-binding protein
MAPQATVLFAGIALALLGCGAGDAAPKAKSARQLVVGFAQIGAESAWREAESASIKIEAQKRGIELKFADAQQKLENQIQALHSFIAQDVDAVILAPQKEQGFEPVLRELAAEKIPVILVDRGVDADPALYATKIASDFVEEGRLAARWLIANSKGPLRVVELEGTAGSAPAIDRKRGFGEVVAGEPRIAIVRSQNAEFTLFKGKEVMEAILRAEQNAVDAVFAHNDDMALGAIQALEAAGLEPGSKVLVVSIDATRAAFEALIAKRLNATVECNPLLGPAAFDALEKVLAGQPVEKWIVVPDRVFDATNAALEFPNRRY